MALAVMVTVDPEAKVALCTGLVKATVGETLGAITDTVTADEVVTAPRLSNAFAVRVWLPGAGDTQV